MAKTKRDIMCPVCTANGLAKSHAYINNSMQEVFKYYLNKDIIDAGADDDMIAVHILIGKILSSLIYLVQNLLTEPIDFEAYISISRNAIEKLALLNFIMKRPNRREKLLQLFAVNSFDYLTLFSENRDNQRIIIQEWKEQNKWTDSEIGHRIEQLKDPEIDLIYAYSSRLMHGLNRDELLQFDEDKIYMMSYVYINVMILYNNVFVQLPEALYKDSISSKHKAISKNVGSIWSEMELPIYSILELSTFGIQHMPYSKKVKEFIIEHNKKLPESIKLGVFMNYKFKDHVL
jgi:hypothetical protein